MLRTSSLVFIILIATSALNCNSKGKAPESDSEVRVVSAMKDVMWKGELGSSIDLDTISNKKNLYGLGPETYLKGELLINNGVSYVARVSSDSTMQIEQTFEVSAPFFVYTNVRDWNKVELPPEVKTIQDLESFINQKTQEYKRPFAFKLIGNASKAIIHSQNLPPGTQVSSPTEAHQGQVDYVLNDVKATIIGFFSTEHQGIFTHHDSYLHMHLITSDESFMGHLDELHIENMSLFLPFE